MAGGPDFAIWFFWILRIGLWMSGVEGEVAAAGRVLSPRVVGVLRVEGLALGDDCRCGSVRVLRFRW